MKTCEASTEEKRNAHDYPDGVKEEIRHRADQIWEERGECSDGALHDWFGPKQR